MGRECDNIENMMKTEWKQNEDQTEIENKTKRKQKDFKTIGIKWTTMMNGIETVHFLRSEKENGKAKAKVKAKKQKHKQKHKQKGKGKGNKMKKDMQKRFKGWGRPMAYKTSGITENRN